MRRSPRCSRRKGAASSISRSSAKPIACLARCSNSSPARSRARPPSGITACSIPPCPIWFMFSPSNPTGRRPRPRRFHTSERQHPPKNNRLSELPVSLVQLHQRMVGRSLEAHQKLARQHVAILLIVRQLHVFRDAHPAVDVAIEDRRLARLVSHMHVLEPVEVIPTHELDVVLEVRREPAVVGKKIDVVAVADVLADLLLARGIETGSVLQIFVDVGLVFLLLPVLVALAAHRAFSAHPIL